MISNQETNQLAPIALFVYNRPWHTQKTIEALKKNTLAAASDLIIFSDGPKDSLESQESVLALREYLKTVSGFKSVRVVTREKNYGLGRSIVAGVSEIIEEYGRIIVLEDDIITSRYFLEYLNQGLNLYENDIDVISIHSYLYPVKKILPETFFLRGADCQGWATWKRGWDLFEPDGQKLLQELENKKLTKEFDFGGAYQYTRMLRDQIAGKNSSWAIRWYASAFLKNKFTLYPHESLIYNTGFDSSGTNCGSEDNFNTTNEDQVGDVRVKVNRIEIKENTEAHSAIRDYFRGEFNLRARGLRYLGRISNFIFKN
jgi:glycosyltransferase involved in cell wall biosynthesis